MNLKDYDKIKELIDDIIGINTKQGETLKLAIKNYIESKPKRLKPISIITNYTSINSPVNKKYINDAEKAMDKYSKKIQKVTKDLKEKGKFCGVIN